MMKMRLIFRLRLLLLALLIMLPAFTNFAAADSTSINRSVAAGADNACWIWNNLEKYFGHTFGRLSAGHFVGDGNGFAEFSLRFVDVAIPKGATILSASFTLRSYSSWATPNLDIQAFAEDNSTPVTSFDDGVSRPRTTANVEWQQSFGDGWVYASPDIKSVIQEIVDRDNWESGNALQLIISDNYYKYPDFPTGNINSVEFYADSDYNISLAVDYQYYLDIGLRVRGASNIKIGVETLSSHKLRISKDGVTYGIPLLDLTDRNVSPVRIYDATGIKALPIVY